MLLICFFNWNFLFAPQEVRASPAPITALVKMQEFAHRFAPSPTTSRTSAVEIAPFAAHLCDTSPDSNSR
jgi:hypothetical protein